MSFCCLQALAFGGGLSVQLLEVEVQNNTACMVLSVLADSELTVNKTMMMENDVEAGTILGEWAYQQHLK